ncbi:MAG: 3'(2'),5'-bisphosphate nucleotidase CysQ [Proteobacteria bacterium]|nr:3'(2'),5'-bisphosphate nucleotidase CysQ [Pseudomonadota bacterium]
MIELNQTLLDHIKIIAEEAGQAILDIYQQDDFKVQTKSDQSPLTKADLASHDIITKALKKLTPKIPILSEEGEQLESDIKTFWCVDPLDGTKEFIKRNGEFTVNIALIENHQPVLGVIYIPVLNETFLAMRGEGAKKIKDHQVQPLSKQQDKTRQSPIFAVSRSHLNQATQDFIQQYQAITIPAGSSIKLTMLAEGLADAYPRFGPTSLWDMAAGHTILKETGGEIFTLDQQPLVYNINQILNPDLIAVRDKNVKFNVEEKHEA